MLSLSRFEALLAVAIVPLFLVSVVSLITSSVLLNDIVLCIQATMLSSWLFAVEKKIEKSISVTLIERIGIQSSFALLILLSFVDFKLNILTTILGYLYLAAGLYLFYVIPRYFQKLLEANGIVVNPFLNHVSFFVFPIAIWKYQNLIKTLT